MSLLHVSLLIVFIFVCFLLIASVLLQTGKGGGMAGLGGGSSDTAFGAHTANVLQKFTMWCVIAFFGLVVTLSHMSKQEQAGGSVMDSFVAPATESAAPAPTPESTPEATSTAAPAMPEAPATAEPAPIAPAAEAPSAPAQ